MCFRVTMQGPRRYLRGGSVLHPLGDINDHHPLPSPPKPSVHASPYHSILKTSSSHILFYLQTPELNLTTNYFPVVAPPYPSNTTNSTNVSSTRQAKLPPYSGKFRHLLPRSRPWGRNPSLRTPLRTASCIIPKSPQAARSIHPRPRQNR